MIQKLKPNAKDETNSKNEKPSVEQAGKNNKSLNLAFIGGAPFVHLAKKWKTNIFAISMQDIKYQSTKRQSHLSIPKLLSQLNIMTFSMCFQKRFWTR